MRRTVLPSAQAWKRANQSASDQASRALVGSSRMTTGAFLAKARASARRCCSPPLRSLPPKAGPSRVSRPHGSRSSTLRIPAASEACSRRCDVAAGSPHERFSRMVATKSMGLWKSTEIEARRSEEESSERSRPSHKMRPVRGGTSPHSKRMRVLLPAPLGPIRAVIFPAGKKRSSSARASCVAPG